ncbi:MAG: YqiA/YcfP family alpha/beta fold hydrolase [Glaciecola sp.]
MKVIFSHGKESGPWGSKIKRLAATAEALGFNVDSIDYSGIDDADERVNKLCDYLKSETDEFVLIGSSMGGYVSLVASDRYPPVGLFLLAPALYMDGYSHQIYKAKVEQIQIIHGWLDDVIPLDNVYKFARESKCTLSIVNSDHRLNSALDEIEQAFSYFLSNLLEKNQ